MAEPDDLLSVASGLADTAVEIAGSAWFADPAVSYKPDGSSLTEADLGIEQRWREALRSAFPTHGVLGEEFGTDNGSSAYTWVLDPVDGTRQFGAGLLNYSSLIAVCRDETPILGVMQLPQAGARFVALEGRGTTFGDKRVQCGGPSDLENAVVSLSNPRSYGPPSRAGFERLAASGGVQVFDGGSVAYGALVRGLIDICLNGDDLEPFDICALCPIVQGAGGIISDWEGRTPTISTHGRIVATSGKALHQKVLSILWNAA